MILKRTPLISFLLLAFGCCFTLQAQNFSNRAAEATVTTSFVSAWETLAAVNDGIASTSSSSKPSAGAYGNWNGDAYYNTYNWVQYEWSNRINISSTSVYWWSDGGGIL